jgi:hypothetical protein
MPDFSETFLCTAVPDSVQGTKLRLAVLVSPRLTASAAGTEPPPASAPLGSWPDARNWPAITPSWTVTIQQGGTTVTKQAAEIGAGGYDVQTWNALFPATMATTPYQPPLLEAGATDEGSLPAVATFPVAAVRDAVKDLHVHLLDNFRTRFPLLDELQHLDVFRPIIDALDQNVLTTVRDAQSAGEVITGELKNVFAQLDLFHGARPGSAMPAPTVTRVSPNAGPPAGGTAVTVTGSGFLRRVTHVVFHDPRANPADRPATNVVVADDGTTITCTAPPGVLEHTVDVVVSSPGGVSLSSAASKFTYLVPPAVTGVAPHRGPVAGGGQVTVTGSDFIAGNGPDGTPVTKVRFGTAAATGVSVGSGGTSLLCTVPPGAAGEVDVVVTTAGGSSTPSAASKYTYVALPAVTGVGPDTGPVAGGRRVTVTGTHLTGATSVAFGATTATPEPGGSDTSLTCLTPHVTTAGPVHVTVTTADGGTSAPTDADRYTYLALPTVTGVDPDTGPIAGGTSVTVRGTNLGSTASVTFGAAAVTPATVTATSLTALSPAVSSAGEVHVVVHTADAGDSTTSDADTFTYTEQ